MVVSLAEPDGLLCHVSLILSTDTEVHVKEFWEAGEHQVTFSAPTSKAEEWDLVSRGPRLFVFPVSAERITYNLAATLALFEPVLTQGVGPSFANLNRNFLKSYVGLDMQPRSAPDILDIPPEMIRNGDTFDIMRLDGLDPMISWAMGSSTGHTAVALWRGLHLFVCESNAKGGAVQFNSNNI